MEDLERRRDAAEREVRRGNFRTALDAYEALSRDYPDEPRLGERLETLRELLQPMELVHPKAAGVAAPERELSPVETGEAAANRGDFVRAVSAYEQAVAADPANELLRERLVELQTMARAQGLDWTSSAAEPTAQAPAAPSAAQPDGAGAGWGDPGAGADPAGDWTDGSPLDAAADAPTWGDAVLPQPAAEAAPQPAAEATPQPAAEAAPQPAAEAAPQPTAEAAPQPAAEADAEPPAEPEAADLPADPVALLEALLERVRSRRRAA